MNCDSQFPGQMNLSNKEPPNSEAFLKAARPACRIILIDLKRQFTLIEYILR